MRNVRNNLILLLAAFVMGIKNFNISRNYSGNLLHLETEFEFAVDNLANETADNSTLQTSTDENMHVANESLVLKCKCVNCKEDELCGGLWKADKFPPVDNKDPHTKKIHIVISHCKSDLHWVSNFTQGYNISSTHIVTKCGKSVSGAPGNATIQVLSNVGRCDHTYAYYISNILDEKIEKGSEKDSIVMFLKDDMSDSNLHQIGKWSDFESMVRLASSTNGFACGVKLPEISLKMHSNSISAYYQTKLLFKYQKTPYVRNKNDYKSDEVEFNSNYTNLGSFYKSIAYGHIPSELTQVCYGGIFAASYTNIKRRAPSIFQKAEKILSRGNNIQEGHLMERSWASLLATPLEPYQIEALRNYTHQVSKKKIMKGMLFRRVQI